MIDAVLQLVTAAAAAIIAIRAECAINHMTKCTAMLLRIAFYAVAVAAGAGLLAILLGYVPVWREAVMSGGVAAMMLVERRRRGLSSPAGRV